MKNKLFLISLVAVLALILSACGTTAVQTSAAPATPRTITVTGTGKVMLQPDMAYIYIGIHTEKPSAAEAVAQNSANTQQLIAALKAAGVDAKDIQTTNFSIWQSNATGPDGKTVSTTYAVDNTVYLTVRKLDQLGSLLDAAVKAGANNVNSIQFDVADKTQALSQARAAAVKTAGSQAGELADAAGVKLGQVVSIQYYDATPSPMLQGKGMGGGGMAAADVSVPINPGQMEISVSVTMAYEIK